MLKMIQSRKGQGAMEYLMTYGWAILVVIIVGVVLWQMGIFNPSGAAAPGQRGFGSVKPVEWLCVAGAGAADTVTLVANNAAGGPITNLTIDVGGTSANCNPTDIAAGETSTCTVNNVDCGANAAGERFEVTAAMSYTSPTGATRSSTGTVFGAAE